MPVATIVQVPLPCTLRLFDKSLEEISTETAPTVHVSEPRGHRQTSLQLSEVALPRLKGPPDGSY